jgi:hypothetical protein
MRRLLLFTALVTLASACSRAFVGRAEPAPARSDSLYWKAVLNLDASNKQGTTDSALKYLDGYLAGDTTQRHRLEALVLRRLARDAMQLARVEAALQQARSTEPARSSTDATPKRDEEAVKEIQRLKDELAKANEELERIRKRLASPKPPSG